VAIAIPEAKYCNLKKNKRLVKGFDFNELEFFGFDTCIHVTGQTNVSVKNISVQGLEPSFYSPVYFPVY
jgi:hypothetical protein